MTSREALDLIDSELEVLEILKKHPDYLNLTDTDNKETKKVKEWLKNG